jgi:hypothetical protein
MRAVGSAREQYYLKTEVDPIAAGEPATVGLLLSAAGAAGLIGLLEYPTRKRASQPGEWCYGRCDLWLIAPRHADDLGWAFEVKRRRITSRSPKHWLIDPFRAAWRDAGMLDVSEGSKRLACTIFYSDKEIEDDTSCAKTLERLADISDWSWRISHQGDLTPLYVFLKQRRRGRCS